MEIVTALLKDFFDGFAVVFSSSCYEWHEWNNFKRNLHSMYFKYKDDQQREATLDEINNAIAYLHN